MMKSQRLGGVGLGFGVLLAVACNPCAVAHAGESGILGSAAEAVRTGSLAPFAGDWSVTLGVEGRMRPAFEGSKDYDVIPVPIVQIRRPGQTARFRSVRDSGGIALINTSGFYAGPSFKFLPARKADDHDALRGLGDVDWTLEVGAFAEYWPMQWLRARAELRRGFNGHEGFVGDLALDVVMPFAERWTLSGGPRLSLADSKATQPYFSIDAVQSIASGLPAFDARGGVRSVGAGAQVRYQWDAHWATRAYVEYDRLTGDAAASPLVTQRGSADQFTVGIGLSYSFDVKW